MEYIHIQKNINSSPRKLRLVADVVRKMAPDDALEVLKFTNKRAAEPLAKAIKTVLANAGRKENLVFKRIEINEGMKLKRIRFKGRGHVSPYKRRMSHIKIVLTDELGGQKLSIKDKESSKTPYRVEEAIDEIEKSEKKEATKSKPPAKSKRAKRGESK